MRKPQITRIWLIGLITLFVGMIIMGVSMGLMFANGGSWVWSARNNGYDFIPRTDSYFWSTLSVMIVGAVIVLAGGVAQLAAWVGALINTYRLPERTWFIVLLVGGLIGLWIGLTNLAVMIAYVIAGPDGMAEQPMRRPPEAPPAVTMPHPTSLAPS